MSQLEDYLLGKEAETSGTRLMPSGAPTHTDINANPAKTIRKTGEALDLTNEDEGVTGEQISRLPQAKPLALHVDTTGKEAPARETKKVAEHLALPSHGRYPLDSYAQVKQANVYFAENYKAMAPELRREYGQNLCKRASALGIRVDPMVRRYGSGDYGTPAEIDNAFLSRSSVVKEASHQQALTELRAVQPTVPVEDFVTLLGEFDKVAGIDGLYDSHIEDPYYAVLGDKLAAEADEQGAVIEGNDYASYNDIRRLAVAAGPTLEAIFDEDLVKKFKENPVKTTEGLPHRQKKVILRLASSQLSLPLAVQD